MRLFRLSFHSLKLTRATTIKRTKKIFWLIPIGHLKIIKNQAYFYRHIASNNTPALFKLIIMEETLTDRQLNYETFFFVLSIAV